MSLPTDSVAPAPPTGSSNPWSLVQWWKRICDWIAALSPSGATEYDTGWVTVAPASGFTATVALQVRRVGTEVSWRGRVNRTAGAFPAGTDVMVVADGTIPAQFRPSSFSYTVAVVSNAVEGLASAQVTAAGGIVLRVPNSISGSHNNFYLAALSGYQVG